MVLNLISLPYVTILSSNFEFYFNFISKKSFEIRDEIKNLIKTHKP